MYVPFHSDMQAKDAIARELLDLDDEDEATEAIDEAYEHAVDVSVDISSRAGDPDFLNDDRETDIDILTGDAE
ncbi:hypothetical protein [Halovenus sp. HT40]|uniref:hypothetical protein n=1 Tax=Halovenus sp. HT40 TaxID=3126691 RepID=UPI00300E6E94